jgi:hypothetical protein
MPRMRPLFQAFLNPIAVRSREAKLVREQRHLRVADLAEAEYRMKSLPGKLIEIGDADFDFARLRSTRLFARPRSHNESKTS